MEMGPKLTEWGWETETGEILVDGDVLQKGKACKRVSKFHLGAVECAEV